MSEEQKKQNPTTDEQQASLSEEELDAANGGIVFNPKYPELKKREKEGFEAIFKTMYGDD